MRLISSCGYEHDVSQVDVQTGALLDLGGDGAAQQRSSLARIASTQRAEAGENAMQSTIDADRPDFYDLQALAREELPHRRSREVLKMARGMNHPPAAAAQARQWRSDIPRCEKQPAAARQHFNYAGDDRLRMR